MKPPNIEQAKYEYDGPETLPYDKLKEMGYKLPFYADLSSERKLVRFLRQSAAGKGIPVLCPLQRRQPSFYADLSSMPELERKVIWGMMVGQEGKTNVPVYKNFTESSAPARHPIA